MNDKQDDELTQEVDGVASWVALNGFNPYSYMEQWIEDHPECLVPYLVALERRGGEEPQSKRYGGNRW